MIRAMISEKENKKYLDQCSYVLPVSNRIIKLLRIETKPTTNNTNATTVEILDSKNAEAVPFLELKSEESKIDNRIVD